ncbi:Ig-like domain-containing protein [Methanoculleus sp.]|uniref:Ig-like domain-containing protein n=1 Tax=Methanoculleus sp. TaxID=90427 RepID=UPI002FC920D5
MTKHTHLALLWAAVIVGLLISPVMAVAAPGDHLYRGFNAAQNRPDVDNNVIVWEDGRDGNMEIYLGTADAFRASLGYTGERVTNNPASQEKPSISGDYIAWQDDRDGDREIYLYQRSTGATTRLTNNPDDQRMPIVRGNYVAWYDSNSTSGRTNVVLYDIAQNETTIIDADAKTTIPGGSTEFKPALSEQYVAWIEAEDEKVHYYDITAGTMEGSVSTSMGFQSWPWLSGSLIAWEDYRHGSSNAEIYMADLDNPSIGEQRITNAPGYQISPAISGDLIAWEDMRDGNRSIYMYDLSTDEEMSVFVPEGSTDEQLYPAASGNTIVWQRGASPNSNLYIFVYEPGAPVEPVATDIVIDPIAATVAVNSTMAFEATVLDQNNETMMGVTVNWTTSDPTIGTVDNTGLFTGVAAGITAVTATAGDVSASAIVTVSAEAPVEPPEVASITVAPATATLQIGGTRLFEATVLDQNDEELSNATVTWASSDEAVGTIDETGLFTAVAEGTTTVNATIGNITGEATVTVSAEAPVEPVAARIAITSDRTTAVVNETVNFSATVYDLNDTEMPDATVAWTSSDEAIGTIDANGLFTAVAEGTTNVTATAENASASVLVTVEAPPEPVLESIAVTPSAATLAIDDTQRFIVTARDQNGNAMTGVNVTWTSSDSAIGTIDETGIFTALAEGTANVTATAENITGEATVTVISNEPALASIAVTPSEITFGPGDTATFTATALDQFGDIMTGANVTWTSSDPAVGTIGTDGVFTALADGMTTVTATAGNMTGEATVTVATASSGVVVSPSTITLGAGESRQFTATVYDQDGNATPGASVAWASSDEAVGTIDETGLFTAVADGTATITVTAENETGTATVTVASSPVATRIAVEPATATVLPGATREFTATVYDQRDNAMDWIQVTWASSDPEIGTIDRAGLFGAFTEGSADVTASAGEATGTAAVTVSATAAPDPDQGGNGGSSSGGSGGGSSEPTFSAATCENLRSGESFTFSELTTTSVGSVNVTAAGTIPQMMLTVKKAKAPSAAEPPTGDVYEYVEITPHWVNPSLIGSATVFFSVPADWLKAHNATAEDVGLMHYVNGTWEPLETTVIGEENGRHNFRATTPGFSTFAIVASPVSVAASAVEGNATTEVTETPTVTETPVATENVTTEPTTAVPATTSAPLVYAPFLAPLAFLLWARRKH